MTTQATSAFMQGTLDLLILRILRQGPEHGQGIARAIDRQSEGVLLIDHGSLYPALQRLEAKGWISAKWGTSSNNRQARFYSLTAKGRRQVTQGAGEWRKFVAAMARIVGTDPHEA
jgi:transcriptional regulator